MALMLTIRKGILEYGHFDLPILFAKICSGSNRSTRLYFSVAKLYPRPNSTNVALNRMHEGKTGLDWCSTAPNCIWHAKQKTRKMGRIYG